MDVHSPVLHARRTKNGSRFLEKLLDSFVKGYSYICFGGTIALIPQAPQPSNVEYAVRTVAKQPSQTVEWPEPAENKGHKSA
jgi:hypothetical protein